VETIFYKQEPCDLDLMNPKSIEVMSCLTKTHKHVKYESSVINSSEDNEQKPLILYFYKHDLEPKINRGLVLTKTNSMLNIKAL